PLIVDHDLSEPFRNALALLFRRYNRNRDGVMSRVEFRQFVQDTNGQTPELAFVDSICQHYSGRSSSGMTLPGFCAFFKEQALHEPVEVRDDLAKHGFDKATLRHTVL
ncbi:hypothetical protein BJ085DRAFT_1103, partial [Dimargaris cristalligena]